MASSPIYVVGVDGSERSHDALVWAAERVPASGDLHVVHAFSPRAELALAVLQRDWVPLRHEAENALETSWSQPARDVGCSVHTEVLDDDPAGALMSVADRFSADAIVVGAHGHGASGGAFLGSVARKLLRRSTRPTIVVPEPRTPAGSGPKTPAGFGKVIACVGYGSTSENAALWAANYAATAGLELSLVHAVSHHPLLLVDSPTDVLWSYLDPDDPLDWAEADVGSLKDRLSATHPELKISVRIKGGSAFDLIAAAGADAELVVLGKRHGNALSQAVIGPRIHHLVAGGNFPTAVVPSCHPPA